MAADRLRLLLLAGMLGVVGILVAGNVRPACVRSQPVPPVPTGRLAGAASLPDHQIRFYQARLVDHPKETASWNMLAVGYMRKLREAGDPGYALRAEQAIRRALALDPRDPDAPRLLAWVVLVKHEFADALRQAEALVWGTPDDDRLYGILGDAEIELGRYSEARAAFQRMLDLKPGLAAYTRAAYLRELHGDVPGAIQLMNFAVDATTPRDRENLAWTRVQLGNLYFNHGNPTRAEEQYAEALRAYPGYLYAEAGLGNVRAAQGRLTESAQLYEQAMAAIPLPEMAATLGDIYTRTGRHDDAERQYALVEYIGRLTQLNQVVYNRDLAYFFADHDRQIDQAVVLAEREAALRHDVYTSDTLAWAYYKAGRHGDASRIIARALELGTQDARLFYHAGMIAWTRGDRPQAKAFLAKALQTNPNFHVLHADAARRLLERLTP